jgi:hypothetical protein
VIATEAFPEPGALGRASRPPAEASSPGGLPKSWDPWDPWDPKSWMVCFMVKIPPKKMEDFDGKNGVPPFDG